MFMEIAPTLAELLPLEQLGPDDFRSGFNDRNLGGEVFGGQYFGQSLWAAMQTAPTFTPQSIFGCFLRAASAQLPLQFQVERTREGRRFAHRRVSVMQSGKEVFRAEVSLFQPGSGHPEHQRPMPDAPDPAALKSLRQLAAERREWLGEQAFERITKKHFFDTFPVNPGAGMGSRADEPAGLYWVRADLDEPAAEAVGYPALAYLSDVMANMASRAPYVANAYDASLSALSLNHGIWFHAPPRPDQWLLFQVESQFAAGGIGSNRGLIYGEDGSLQASFAQDALIEYP